ncbi:hypothetical protein HPB52_016970 [Rhipicephalus sanguineus]|uniref:Uncharacterized protein n=1 Tax=Rhipicephalus sanguineus TaxID=34632 RepID=A0A9D4QE50_RHISA|nr:hypothetical protein HPB52_016970 [Rhipicephalus sanguineus]
MNVTSEDIRRETPHRTQHQLIDGVVNEIPREAPLLKRDAVPTVFEDYAICSNRKFPCRKLVSVVREQERAHESSERRNGGNCTSESRLDVDAVSDSQDDVDFTGEAALSSERRREYGTPIYCTSRRSRVRRHSDSINMGEGALSGRRQSSLRPL